MSNEEEVPLLQRRGPGGISWKYIAIGVGVLVVVALIIGVAVGTSRKPDNDSPQTSGPGTSPEKPSCTPKLFQGVCPPQTVSDCSTVSLYCGDSVDCSTFNGVGSYSCSLSCNGISKEYCAGDVGPVTPAPAPTSSPSPTSSPAPTAAPAPTPAPTFAPSSCNDTLISCDQAAALCTSSQTLSCSINDSGIGFYSCKDNSDPQAESSCSGTVVTFFRSFNPAFCQSQITGKAAVTPSVVCGFSNVHYEQSFVKVQLESGVEYPLFAYVSTDPFIYHSDGAYARGTGSIVLHAPVSSRADCEGLSYNIGLENKSPTVTISFNQTGSISSSSDYVYISYDWGHVKYPPSLVSKSACSITFARSTWDSYSR